MPAKYRTGSEFAQRLVALRKARGVTQVQLAQAIGSTQRAISYYENDADYPPAPVITAMARALGVSADEMLGLRPIRKTHEFDDPAMRRLWKKFRMVLSLPEKDQRAVIRLVNSLVSGREGNGRNHVAAGAE